MGISLPTAKMMMELGVSVPFSGRVLQLGRQDIYFTQKQLEQAARAVGFTLQDAIPEPTVRNPFLPGSPEVISDRFFFRKLGFSAIDSLDASDFEGASIVFDLNRRDGPPEHRESFDVIIDGGTLEHIFHLPNALTNIAEWLRPGGRVIHISPTNNFFEHGFFCFNPTLFYDYYSANGFRIVTSQLVEFDPASDVNRANRLFLFPADAGVAALCRAGSLSGRCHCLFFVAQKIGAGTGTAIPQQNAYVEAWAGKPDPNRSDPRKTFPHRILKKIVRQNRRTLGIYQAWKARSAIRRLPWKPV